MILKEKTLQIVNSPTAKAGQKQEKDVAFFLRRAFKDHPDVFVINDFKFTHNDETAQIDHLILYPYGFVLVESKSITGEVKVNDLGEWSRSLAGKWSGMSSPIKQVELQQRLLRELLHKHRVNILGKILGKVQTGFGGRCWDNLCVVSSNAIIHRETIPSSVSNQLVKTEFLVDKLIDIMKMKNVVLNLFDTRPRFTKEELESTTLFLMSQLNPIEGQLVQNVEVALKPLAVTSEITASLSCKKCGEKSDYSPQYGRYGYFIKCNKCDTNTAMKMPCVTCNSKNTKVTKKSNSYTLNCSDCNSATLLIS